MFQELFKIASKATLAMTISADEATGQMTINVIPKPKTDLGEAALSTPLSLTATPAEFDAEFVNALASYRGQRESLAAQAEVTKELLSAAQAASARKGTSAVAKASATKVAGSKASPVRSEPEADDQRDDAVGDATVPSATASADTDAASPAAPGEPQVALFGQG